MLELHDVHAYYGPAHILQGISLIVKEGEIVCLLGRNGVGKTTTLKTIIGLLPPKSGTIKFRGEEIGGRRPHEISRLGIGYVPQGRRIFPNLSVRENLAIGARKSRGKEFNESLEKVYRIFPILKERSKQMGRTLSGGEQQMLAIARALMGKHSLILMDEPSEGLAVGLVKELARTILRIRDEGVTILLVEQNARIALEISDRVYVMEKGKIRYEGTSNEIKQNIEAIRTLGI